MHRFLTDKRIPLANYKNMLYKQTDEYKSMYVLLLSSIRRRLILDFEN